MIPQSKQWDVFTNHCGGGIDFYPYQIALGISIRYWPCLHAPAFRIYFGPLKIWGYINLRAINRLSFLYGVMFVSCSIYSLNEFHAELFIKNKVIFQIRHEGYLWAWWIFGMKIYQNFNPNEW